MPTCKVCGSEIKIADNDITECLDCLVQRDPSFAPFKEVLEAEIVTLNAQFGSTGTGWRPKQ